MNASLPKRYSLFLFVLVMPVVASALFAIAHYRIQQNRHRALQQFIHDVRNGLMADPRPLVKRFDLKQAASIIAEQVREHPTIDFDGHDRWVQVLPVPMAHGHGMGDGYTLVGLSSEEPLHSYTLERGTVIEDVEFTPTGVRIMVSGNIKHINRSHHIPPEKPEVFIIPWPKGDHIPTLQNAVYSLMFRRHNMGGAGVSADQ